jgi:hypothetical protein
MAEIYPGKQYFKDAVGLVKIKSITFGAEIWFLPYDLKITENLTPEWNQETVIGRMDPIARFKRMGRTMNVNFKARAKEQIDFHGQEAGPYLPYDDLLHSVDHLKRLCYPRYDSKNVMTSPPIFRIQCENLILAGENTKDKGVLCFITTLKADPIMDKNTVLYKSPSTGIGGNLPGNAMYPKGFDINIGFTVLNEQLSEKQVSGVLNETYFYHFTTTSGPAGGHPGDHGKRANGEIVVISKDLADARQALFSDSETNMSVAQAEQILKGGN